MDDEIDLSKAELLANSALGVFIPQHFVELAQASLRHSHWTGISLEDWKVLAAGPDQEHYWDAWADVLDNAKYTDPNTKQEYYLHQEGDLWLVPVEPPVQIVKMFGYEFRPMNDMDWSTWAGAEEGTLIYHLRDERDTVLLWDPKNQTLSEYWTDKDENQHARDWTYQTVMC